MSDSHRSQPLDQNPNWKGGRTVTSHGYVLVKRPNHRQSDTRGYVYEHRIVAEEVVGREIKGSEHVHHKNGDKKDNRPENLEVLTAAEHRARHRGSDELRDPGERNPIIECGCGCGETLQTYDESGRPREYISGHNPQPRPVQKAILEELEDGPSKRHSLITSIGRSEGAVASALSVLQDRGEVVNPKTGTWALPEDIDKVDTEQKENHVVECACGCGKTFPKYDDSGRSRKYVTGHNSNSPVRDGVLSILEDGPAKRADIADQLGCSRNSVQSALTRLCDRGSVQKAEGWGMWELTPSNNRGEN